MFEYLRLRWFFSKVKASLKDQHGSQAFVNRLCNRVDATKAMQETQTYAAGDRDDIIVFLAACSVLEQALDAGDVTDDDRETAISMLSTRLSKAAPMQDVWNRHKRIFQRWEDKVLSRVRLT
jgi:hypothetical protein